ncbi:MAG: response regulator [Flavobacteriales bacterium]
MEMDSIRIAVFEDDTVQRSNLAEWFTKQVGFELAGAFADANSAEADVSQCKPHVVLMDIDMPGTDGYDALVILHAAFPEIQVVMHTGNQDGATIFNCFLAGAAGYISKDSARLELADYLRIIYNGGTQFPPSIALQIREYVRNGMQMQRINFGLTEREMETLQLLCNGHPPVQIADTMHITTHGVNKSMRRIFEKLQVHSTQEAIVKAFKSGIVQKGKFFR